MTRTWQTVMLMGVMAVAVVRPAQAQYPTATYPPPPANVSPLVALHGLLGAEALVGTSEVVREGPDLVVRVAPPDASAELRRERIATRATLEIRVHRNAAGQIESITRAGDLAARRAVRLAATASEAEKTAALASAKYGTRARVLPQLRQRGWGPLGGRGSVQDVTLQWMSARGQLEAVWIVTLKVQRASGLVMVVATVDAGSGTVLSLARQGAL